MSKKVNEIAEFQIIKKTFAPNAKLKKLLEKMAAHGVDGLKLLPKAPYEICSFNVLNSRSGFVNALRSVVIQELPTVCMHVQQNYSGETLPSAIYTDDRYLSDTADVIIKNINSIPINQKFDFAKYKFYLYVENQTLGVLNVYASDIRSRHPSSRAKKTTGGGKPQLRKSTIEAEAAPSLFTLPAEILYDEKNAVDIHELIPNPQGILARLRPGKCLFISDIIFEEGVGFLDHAKFTHVNSVIYLPLSTHFVDGGKRSTEHEVVNYYLKFATCGTCSSADVLYGAADVLIKYMERFIKTIAMCDMGDKLFYANDEVSISCVDLLYTYKFKHHYHPSINMLAQQCFKIDPTIAFCSGSVDSYNVRNSAREDIRSATLKLKHMEPNKLITLAATQNIAELKEFKKNISDLV
jgi:hypothetical protein